MNFYDRYILPGLVHFACSTEGITNQRKRVVPLARGRVLEIGIGSGLNLPFYNPENIEFVWGLDPSAELKRMAEKKAATLPFKVDFIGLSGEDIPLEDNCADTVILTYTMCSISDINKALREMRRVLKPGGSLIFCEHGKSPDAFVAKWQDRLNPIWKKACGGCNLNRPIPELIKKEGFKIQTLEMDYMSNLKFLSFNYLGVAIPE